MKRYLGDGVYAEVMPASQGIRVYTSDGLRDTNEIFFDEETSIALCQFFADADKVMKGEKE